ncbi:hypothetical protein OU426_10695 [Frigidibacter sp. RF13]|uniref:hypothetical protein n=1 Tax=Frigidibacter sp. RF13 TaxID=2997340 RepID=UPI00226FCEBF|nr:hypothetical protein [Frigidibacter sp. RF13]MCY1127320.1 hypothetical protein [Frigidibacter sp. RF13]
MSAVGRLVQAGLFVAMSALGASAATMNFVTLPDEGAQLGSYSENGIVATALGGALAYEGTPGFAHLDDSGTGLAYGIDFTMGGLFDAVEFSLTSLGYDFWDPPGPLSDNLIVTGFNGSSVVSMAGFILSDVFGATQTFTLGPAFSGLTSLRIELIYPTNSASCGAPCGHLDLDYVTLNGPSAVPLPASGLMLVAAGFGLGALRLRRRA